MLPARRIKPDRDTKMTPLTFNPFSIRPRRRRPLDRIDAPHAALVENTAHILTTVTLIERVNIEGEVALHAAIGFVMRGW
jgi:hypothetical protein